MRKTLLALIVTVLLLINSDVVMAKTVAKERVNGYTISVTQSKQKTTVKWNGKKIHSYKFRGKTKIVSERKLTEKMLLRRKNKTLYIERIIGKVVNNRLDGETTEGHYMSYRCLRGKAHKGDVIITYCIYNPFTKWIDDIDERYDIIL